MAFSDIVRNGKYADDLVFDLPDGTKGTLGEIRALPAAERTALTAQIDQRKSVLDQAEAAFANKFQEALKLGWIDENGKVLPPKPATTTTSTSTTTTPTDATLRRAAAVEFGLDESDPLLGPVVKEMKSQLAARDAKLDELRAELSKLPASIDSLKTSFTDALGKVTGVVNTSVGRYLNDTYQQQFASATKDLPKGVTVDYEAAYKYASDHSLKDKEGFLQIADAVDRLTWDARKKAERAEWEQQERAKILKEAAEKSQLATLTPPNRNPLQQQNKTTKEGEFNPYTERTDSKGNKVRAVKSFEDAMNEAMSDEDVLKSALGTASFGMVQ